MPRCSVASACSVLYVRVEFTGASAKRRREAVAARLRNGSGMRARDLVAIRFDGGAIRAASRTVLLFEDGESSVSRVLLYRNGYRAGRRQLRGGLDDGVELIDTDPKLRDVRDFANPDPRPEADSPALAGEGDGYIEAFGRTQHWLAGWTVFGPESVYDLRERAAEDN